MKFHLPASSRLSSNHRSDFGEDNREFNASFISFSASAQDTKGFMQHYYSVSLCSLGKLWADAATSIFTKKKKDIEW